MKIARAWILVLEIIALILLFLKLPETPNPFSFFGCKTCTVGNIYLVLIGTSYFSLLIALSLLFPSFPTPQMARAGLSFAIMLALALTLINYPNWCLACLMIHACHILIWTLWLTTRSTAIGLRTSPFAERIFLTLFAPICMVTLFSCLNLTFMAYNMRINHTLSSTSLKQGDEVPGFHLPIADSVHPSSRSTTGMIVNFVSSDCPYCQIQLSILNNLSSQLSQNYRIINISPLPPAESTILPPLTEWIEDKEGTLRALFKVSGYPTLFVLKEDGKIGQVITGVPDQLKTTLLSLSPTLQESQ